MGKHCAALGLKVGNPWDCCYIVPNDIHEMHIAIKPIVNAFSNLVNNFSIISGTERLNTPLDKLNLIPRGKALHRPTKTTHPYLFTNGKICNLTLRDLSSDEDIRGRLKLEIKPSQELVTILKLEHHNWLSTIPIIESIRKLYNEGIKNLEFDLGKSVKSIEDLHKYNGSGSITYRRILQKTPNYTIEKCNPAKKMEKDRKISDKNRKNTGARQGGSSLTCLRTQEP